MVLNLAVSGVWKLRPAPGVKCQPPEASEASFKFKVTQTGLFPNTPFGETVLKPAAVAKVWWGRLRAQPGGAASPDLEPPTRPPWGQHFEEDTLLLYSGCGHSHYTQGLYRVWQATKRMTSILFLMATKQRPIGLQWERGLYALPTVPRC